MVLTGKRREAARDSGRVSSPERERPAMHTLKLTSNRTYLRQVSLFPDGSHVILDDNQCRGLSKYELFSGQKSALVRTASRTSLYGAVMNADGTLIATYGCSDPELRLWNANTGDPFPTLGGQDVPVTVAVFLPNDLGLLSVAEESNWHSLIRRWNLQSVTNSVVFDPRMSTTWKATMSEDGRIFAISVSDQAKALAIGLFGSVIVIDPLSGNELAIAKHFNGPCFITMFSPDSKVLAVADGALSLLDGVSLETKVKIKCACEAIAFSPDAKLIAAAINSNNSGPSRLELYNVADGNQVCGFQAHNDRLNAINISPDGRLLFALTFDGQLKIWELEDLLSGKEDGSR